MPDPTFRHVWVIASDGERLPGLLREWRQGADGWEGHVTFASLINGEWALVTTWAPAAALEAADYPPPSNA